MVLAGELPRARASPNWRSSSAGRLAHAHRAALMRLEQEGC
jgi:hypothetical protein